MRVVVVGLLALLVAEIWITPSTARAQSTDELVAKNLAARGGADKLAAITSLEFTGKAVEPGNFELAYKETLARKNAAARAEFSLQGLTVVQAYDGTVGWKINPFEGRRDAERMSKDDTRAFADDATIAGPLLDAKARGSTVTSLGREDYEGTNAYKLRVTDPSGVQYDYYLDPDTFLEIKIVETRKVRGAPQVTLTELSDYELVNGVYFPFAIESGSIDSSSEQRQKLIIERGKANVPASAALFAMPASPSAK